MVANGLDDGAYRLLRRGPLGHRLPRPPGDRPEGTGSADRGLRADRRHRSTRIWSSVATVPTARRWSRPGRAAGYRRPGAVRRTDPAEERFAWLAGADLVAMPSRYETFGMVAAEALAVATPVVAFDIPCLRALVDDGVGAAGARLRRRGVRRRAARTRHRRRVAPPVWGGRPGTGGRAQLGRARGPSGCASDSRTRPSTDADDPSARRHRRDTVIDDAVTRASATGPDDGRPRSPVTPRPDRRRWSGCCAAPGAATPDRVAVVDGDDRVDLRPNSTGRRGRWRTAFGCGHRYG